MQRPGRSPCDAGALGADLFQIRLGREASRLVLRVGQLAIDDDVELARLADLDVDGAAPSRFKPSLHTEDFGFVASGGAVVDNDGHVEGASVILGPAVNRRTGARASPARPVRPRAGWGCR